MFTIKLYTHDNSRRIYAAHSFSILETRDGYEITAHTEDGQDWRADIGPDAPRPVGSPHLYAYAYIVNAQGQTVDTLRQPCL